MKHYFVLLLFVFSCSHKVSPEKKLNWKEESQKLASAYAKDMGKLHPEYFSSLGFSVFNGKVTPYSSSYEQDSYALTYRWQQRLMRLLMTPLQPEFSTDVKILLEVVNHDLEGIELSRREGIVPFMGLTENIYGSLNDLLHEEPDRRKLEEALRRFRLYVRGEDKLLPLKDGFMAHLFVRLNDLKNRRKRGFWPMKSEVQSYLDNSDEYLVGIEKLLSKWPGEEWKRDFEELKNQDQDYKIFLKKKILPYCRTHQKTPPAIYAFMLKDYGIFDPPEKLIKTAHEDYKKTYQELRVLALDIAREEKLPKSDPQSVLKVLEEGRFQNDQDLLNFYNKSITFYLKMIEKKKLLTLKKSPPIKVRFGSASEMQSIPAPHYNAPENGEKFGEYIIPRVSGKNGMNDYSYPEAILNLTAHEAVPGHGLQHQAIKERGTTLIRSKFAFNSANVEGWAHYAESIVMPYLNSRQKLVALQRRLWRQARMFLDPELNLGKIEPQKVFDVYMKELGFSREFAASEFKRYSYIMPGQAGAYYYGFKVIEGTKSELKSKHDDTFQERCFNDALLDLGVLPLKIISDRLKAAHPCALGETVVSDL